jgi:hypothetical protein
MSKMQFGPIVVTIELGHCYVERVEGLNERTPLTAVELHALAGTLHRCAEALDLEDRKLSQASLFGMLESAIDSFAERGKTAGEDRTTSGTRDAGKRH